MSLRRGSRAAAPETAVEPVPRAGRAVRVVTRQQSVRRRQHRDAGIDIRATLLARAQPLPGLRIGTAQDFGALHGRDTRSDLDGDAVDCPGGLPCRDHGQDGQRACVVGQLADGYLGLACNVGYCTVGSAPWQRQRRAVHLNGLGKQKRWRWPAAHSSAIPPARAAAARRRP